MTRSSAFKLILVFILTFILCLPEFFPKVSKIQFCCEPFDPCRPENDAKFCGQADPPCATELINGSSQHRRDEGWYLCKAEIDLRLLHNNTSQSVEDVMVLLTMKAGNLTGWNISVFALLNNTELYTGPQNDQRLFYCYLTPDNSKCLDLNMSTEEPTQQNSSHPRQNTSILKTTSAKPITSSLKTTISSQVTASTHELQCQTTSSSFLFYYNEHNETARSAALPVTQTKKVGWGVITSVWLALVLTVIVVTLLSVSCLIFKSKHRKSHLFTIVPVSASGHQVSKPTENLMSNVPDVTIAMYSMSDDDVFFESSSTENRTEENLLRVADLMYTRRLSPIVEITGAKKGQGQDVSSESLKMLPLEDAFQDENEEEEQCNAPETKEEFKKSHQLQHLAAQGNCEPSTYLHHRNNFSCSGH